MMKSFGLRLATMWIVLLLSGMAQKAQAQDPNLAAQYFSNGEFEKAASLYSQLFERNNNNDYYFSRYVESMLNLEQYDECEKAIKKQIRKSPQNNQLYFMYGNLYDRQNKTDEANAQYQQAIDKMAPDFGAITRLASQLTSLNKYDLAIAAYEQGSKLLNDNNIFALNLGELYRRRGNSAKMIEYYLNALDAGTAGMPNVQTLLARFLAPEDFPELQTQLYDRLQKKDNPDYIELLAWSFLVQKDFKSALRQYKALDKRAGEAGQRVMGLARSAQSNKDYDTAIDGYEYIIREKGSGNLFFFEAKRDVMECRRLKITEGYDFTPQDLSALEAEYEAFLGTYGKGKQTAEIVLQLAQLEGYYLNKLDKAIQLLEDLRKSPGIQRNDLGRIKIDLADYYLMHGEIWESTLLYSQVDKEFREELLGQEARFKNARLAYFNGDFQWAQAQCEVLRASTSKLIANDALDLSVFIMDNLNLDTNAVAISLYSAAELQVYQNRFDEAFLKLDTLRREFPEHMLQDDILYLEAQIHDKKREWSQAAQLYQEIMDKYPQEIRADNAIWALAQLYDTKLNDTEKAKSLYEKLFIDYSGSVYAVDARKRYRVLRGDSVQ